MFARRGHAAAATTVRAPGAEYAGATPPLSSETRYRAKGVGVAGGGWAVRVAAPPAVLRAGSQVDVAVDVIRRPRPRTERV
eukprot:gene51398-66932_t